MFKPLRPIHLVSVSLLASTALAAVQSVDEQGWDAATRNNFYTQDQGTRLIPWSWISALRQADDSPFMVDSLARYGYLPNPKSSPANLPILSAGHAQFLRTLRHAAVLRIVTLAGGAAHHARQRGRSHGGATPASRRCAG